MALRIAVLLSCFLLFADAAHAQAQYDQSGQQDTQNQKIRFEIRQQSLSSALLDYSYQSKVQLIMPGVYASGLYTAGVIGIYDPQEALGLLLKGTHLQFEFISSATVSIRLKESDVTKKKHRRRDRSEVVGIDQIIVTAQGREEKIQDVSLAVTALEGEDLEKRGVTNLDELQVFVPGLTVESSLMADTSFTIRGIGASNDDISIDLGIGVYIDDIYIPRQSAANMIVYDLQRVEVLKGAQGTLYGKNASGGVVRYVSRKPTADFDARYLIDVGNHGRFNNVYTLNGEIADDLYGQIGLARLHRSGIMENNSPLQAEGNEIDSIAARTSLRYMPNADTELLLTLDTEKTDQAGNLFSVGPKDGYQLMSTTAPLPASNPLRSSNATITSRDKRDIDGLMLRANLETESAIFSTILGARQHVIQNSYDIDQQAEMLASRSNDENSHLLTAELRLISKRDQALTFKGKAEWAAGLYYSKDRSRAYKPFDLSGFAYGQNAWTQIVGSQSYAVYAQGEFAISPLLRFTSGLRYTIDDKETDIVAFTDTPTINNPLISENFQYIKAKRWTGVTPKIALSYSTSEDILFYSSYTEGYKAGGFNGSLQSQTDIATAELEAEKSHHYELGLKSRFFDNRAKFNLVMFYIDYNDLQVRQHGRLGNTVIVSAPESVIKGFEVELQARPTTSFNLSTGVSALNAEFTRFTSQQAGVLVDRAGEPIPSVPDVTVNASVAYFLPETDSGFYSIRADAIYSDKALLDESTLAWPNYRVYNLWFDFIPQGSKWEMGLWVRNLLNEVYYRGTLSSEVPAPDSYVRKLEEPRMVGASFKFKW